jgi:hypothetical protein
VSGDGHREIGDLSSTERENRAVEEFVRWWTSARTRILLSFALPAVVLGFVGYWFVQELQFQLMEGEALLLVNALGFFGPVAAAVWLGRVVGKKVVLARSAAKLDKLARTYNLPREQLDHATQLLRGA